MGSWTQLPVTAGLGATHTKEHMLPLLTLGTRVLNVHFRPRNSDFLFPGLEILRKTVQGSKKE